MWYAYDFYVKKQSLLIIQEVYKQTRGTWWLETQHTRGQGVG